MKLLKTMMVITGIFLLIVGIVLAAAGELPTANPATATTDAPGPAERAALPLLTDPIRIVHPAEQARLPLLKATFVCGSVTAPGRLLINGAAVPVHPDGGFVAMVDLTPGQFVIKVELIRSEKTYVATRRIMVGGAEAALSKASQASPRIAWVAPLQHQQLLPGDTVTVACQGTPGQKAYFTVKGNRKKFKMSETSDNSGVYQGVYRIDAKKLRSKAHFKVTLVDQSKRKVTKEAPGTVSLFPDQFPVMAKVTQAGVVLRSGPAIGPQDSAGYEMFPPSGTVLRLTGRIGKEYRVRLNQTKTVWVSVDQVQLLGPGHSPAPVVVGDLRVTGEARHTLIRIPLARKLPFQIIADSKGKYLDLLLFGAYSNTDRIANGVSGVIRQLSCFQDSDETYRLRVATVPKSWWGYEARYEGDALVIDLKSPPPLTGGVSPLEGLTIAVDAGHGSGNGAIGCTGYAEGDANFALAANLQAKLLAKGAKVILTRPGKVDVPLAERPQIAIRNNADLLLSLHNNSMSYDGNPLKKHGFEIYYFTPMSLALAREIHRAYGRTFGSGSEYPLPDGGVHFGNLALTRAPQMPSILIETAYMIVPQEEAYLKTEGFRSACSDAIIAGLERYAGRMRAGKTVAPEVSGGKAKPEVD